MYPMWGTALVLCVVEVLGILVRGVGLSVLCRLGRLGMLVRVGMLGVVDAADAVVGTVIPRVCTDMGMGMDMDMDTGTRMVTLAMPRTRTRLLAVWMWIPTGWMRGLHMRCPRRIPRLRALSRSSWTT